MKEYLGGTVYAEADERHLTLTVEPEGQGVLDDIYLNADMIDQLEAFIKKARLEFPGLRHE